MGDHHDFRASYAPFGARGEAAGRDQEPTEVEFLLRVADVTLRAGDQGVELRHVDLAGRRFTFASPPTPDTRLPFYSAGPVPDDARERADVDAMPLAVSPPWTHLFWLVQELGVQLGFFREHGARLVEIDAPSRAWADVVVEHGGRQWRARVRLEGRDEPIEYPAMNLAEMFGEGRHLALAEDGIIHGAV